VEIARSHLVVEEDIGEIRIPLRRTGDTSQRLYVSCVTTSQAEEEGTSGSEQCQTGLRFHCDRDLSWFPLYPFCTHKQFREHFRLANLTVKK